MDVFIQYAIAASQFAMDDSGLTITPENADRVGVFIASGIGGFATIEREHPTLLEGGPRQDLAVLHPGGDHQPGRRPRVDPIRRQGAEPGHLHRLLGVGARDRRRLRDHPPRRRRRDDRRRLGGGDHADGRRRASRRCGPCPRATTSRSRRAGRSTASATGSSSARARASWCSRSSSSRSPRGPHLRRDRRLRGVGRRVPHHRAVRGRRRRRAGDAGGASRRRPVGGRLHQRPRHLDAAQRPDRDDRHQAVLRRARPQAGHLVDQVDDRAPARRGRRARGRHHRPGDPPPGRAADDQPRAPGPGVRSRLRPERVPRGRPSGTRCRTRSGSAARTPRCCSSGSKGSAAPGTGRAGRAHGSGLTAQARAGPEPASLSPEPWAASDAYEDCRLHQAGSLARLAAARQRGRDVGARRGRPVRDERARRLRARGRPAPEGATRRRGRRLLGRPGARVAGHPRGAGARRRPGDPRRDGRTRGGRRVRGGVGARRRHERGGVSTSS